LKVIEVLFEDLEYFFSRESDMELFEQILKNTSRYVKLFSEAVDKIMPEKQIRLIDDETVEDIILTQRRQNLSNNNSEGNAKTSKQLLPPEIMRR
jgi:DNA replication licensing factor MCM7